MFPAFPHRCCCSGVTVSSRVDRPATASRVNHVGYGLASFGDLVRTYERLEAEGITPFGQLNHRFTTSLYYHDPDGNEVEFSVDNFPTKEECSAFRPFKPLDMRW